MSDILASSPAELAEILVGIGGSGHVVLTDRGPTPSHDALTPIADFLRADTRDSYGHEGVYLAVGRRTGTLLAAFVHWTDRGQAAGGLRHWGYDDTEALLRDGLRLSAGMTRKNALAGLWWGGGKGIIARTRQTRDPAYRQAVYADYGDFITTLRGVYVTAEDVGTTPADMIHVYRHTRHVTCVPPEVGGSGNPSTATAAGVVCAMEGALAELGRGELAGKTVAMQGAGNVAAYMMEELLQRGVARIVATDIDAGRLAAVNERLGDERVELRLVAPDDTSIFREPCDVLAPNALGGCLRPDTIDQLATTLVCGAANNQLLDAERDAAHLDARGITYVPDFLANRMGIVQCADEYAGTIPSDPAIARHLGRAWDNAVYVVTRRVLARARDEGVSTSDAANRLADELARQPHPIWPERGRHIARALHDAR